MELTLIVIVIVILFYLFIYLFIYISIWQASPCPLVQFALWFMFDRLRELWVMWSNCEINVLLETANITSKCYSVMVDISALFSEVPILNICISTRDFP
jgi:hypothetical protein